MTAPAPSFAGIADEFLAVTRDVVWCTVTTVAPDGTPRSRILHPIFEIGDDGLPVGWVVTGRTPVKVRDLAWNPRVAVMYWSPAQATVEMTALATWVEEPAVRQHVHRLFTTTPPPLGYPLDWLGAEGPSSPAFTPLRLDPQRVAVLPPGRFPERLVPLVWRRDR